MYNRYIPREEAYRPVEEERPSGGAADFFQSLFHPCIIVRIFHRVGCNATHRINGNIYFI